MNEKDSPWKPCLCSKESKYLRSGALIMAALLMFFAIGLAVYVARAAAAEGTDSVIITVFIIVVPILGIGCFLYTFLIYIVEARKYQMNEEGISILYCGRSQKFYPWSAFRKIVVCDVNHIAKFPDQCDLIIRLATYAEPHGPHSKNQRYTFLGGIEKWRRFYYTMHRSDKILFWEYSPALLEKMVHLSNLQVMYSLTKYGKAKMESCSMYNEGET